MPRKNLESGATCGLTRGKTVVVDLDGGSGGLDPPLLIYQDHPVKIFQIQSKLQALGLGLLCDGPRGYDSNQVTRVVGVRPMWHMEEQE